MNRFYAITTVSLGVAWSVKSMSKSHDQLTNNNEITKENMDKDEKDNGDIVTAILKYHEISVEVAYHPDDIGKIGDIQGALENLESHEEENKLLKNNGKKALGFVADKLNEYKNKM